VTTHNGDVVPLCATDHHLVGPGPGSLITNIRKIFATVILFHQKQPVFCANIHACVSSYLLRAIRRAVSMLAQ